ncbi:MAG: sulfite exporter TauE/SafE family protein [Coriobacteriia bacterium]|nr:sulfite exporter TauE/SafE family protein [Coriobacteriia bacterium]
MGLGKFVLIGCCGLLIGVLSGMFGVGGGTMIVPLLNLAFGVPMLNASSTSLFSIAPTSISGSYRHLRQGTVDVPTALLFGVPGAIASTVSASLSAYLPDWLIMAAAIGVIGFSAFRMFREAAKKPLDETGRTSEMRFKTKRTASLLSLAIGTFAGFIAGIVGVGGGFVIIPFGMALLGRTMKEMSAVSLLAIAVIAVPGIVTHAWLGHIWYLHGLALVIGSVPGASLGVYLIRKVDERTMRYAFGILLLVSGCLLLLNRWVFAG